MTFYDLKEFLESKMRLSHIYQPLLIKSLIESGGSASLRQLAGAFLAQDESQLLYYEKRLKEMPIKVLSKHDVIKKDGEFISLNTGRLNLNFLHGKREAVHKAVSSPFLTSKVFIKKYLRRIRNENLMQPDSDAE